MSKILIEIPENNVEERCYIINILLNEFLSLDYEIKCGENEHYVLFLPNDNILVIEDHFFNKYPNKKDYLCLDNIPKEITFSSNKFSVEDDIVILYGNDKLEVSENKITSGVDIFASSFFMLSRWEEYVNKLRDEHDRFSAKESIAYKFNFLHRPIVNEYIEMLWDMLKTLGIEEQRSEREYSFLLTHDIDTIRKYTRARSGSSEIFNTLWGENNYSLGLNLIVQKIKSHISYNYDPYNSFEYLIDSSEKNRLLSHYFIQIKGETDFDNLYDNQTKYFMGVIEKIKDSGCAIGFHPSYNTYNNFELLDSEHKYLEEITKCNILFGRQHYLRFEVPTTWQIWEDLGMSWDSSMSYADKEGFRCGVCYDFSVFNIESRKKLKLKEKPLIVMEGSFVGYQSDIIPIIMEKKIRLLMDNVKKYKGEFILLWHNSSFGFPIWNNYKTIYENCLQIN